MHKLGPIQTAALEALEGLYREHRTNLIAGGYPPDGARVMRRAWWEECLYMEHVENPSTMARVERSFLKRGLIEIDDLYVRFKSNGLG